MIKILKIVSKYLSDIEIENEYDKKIIQYMYQL